MAKRHVGKRRVRSKFIDRESVLMPVSNDIPAMDIEAQRVIWSELDAAGERSDAAEDGLIAMGISAAR